MPELAPGYRTHLARFERDARFERPLPEDPGIRIGTGGLQALVDPRTHRILALSHPGGALLNALCSVCLGYTVQDAAEHALIRLENLLRDRARPRPVPGVVQPENADDAFHDLQELTRGLLADYARRTGYRIDMNTEEGPVNRPSSEWGTSTVPERIQRILTSIPERCTETGILASEVTVHAIAGPRVTLAFLASAPQAAQQHYLTLLEAVLREKVDPKIEVFLDDKRDGNAKRHTREP